MRLANFCPLIGLLMIPAMAVAELPSPQLHRIEPLGLNTGGQGDLTFLGADNEETETLIFDHAGIQAKFVKDKTFRIVVAGDVPAGTYDVRAVGKFGITNPRLFAVSHHLIDIIEIEPNNTPDKAQTIAVNSAVNGQSDGNSQDLFKVSLDAGQRILIDCQSARLDTELDGTLVLFSSDGRQLASNGDYIGRDPQLDFVAPVAGEYVIEVRDLTYRAGYPYRLIVTDRPSIENVFPRAIQQGQAIEILILGRNLGPGSQPSNWRIGDAASLEQLRVPLTVSQNVLATNSYWFREHPTHHSVLPTAATCTLVGEQVTLLDANPQILFVTDSPTSQELEPNDTREQATPLTLPAVVSGRFDRERDLDWFSFETEEGGVYGFDVYCERIAGRADPYLAVMDDKGNSVGTLDDFGHRIAAFDGHLRDPSGVMTLAPKTKYRVLVKETYQRGGARYQYVLSIRKAQPDFFASCIHSDNNMSGVTIRQGGSVWLDIVIHAKDGFNEPISIIAENLPPGLHAAPLTITNELRGTLILWADEEASLGIGEISLMAIGRRGDQTLRHEVRSYSRVFNQVGSRPTRKLIVAIREKSPYSLALSPDILTIPSGQKGDLKLHLKRIWPEFTGAVNFQPLNFPGQFQLGNGTIPSDQSDAVLSINVQAGTRPGNYSLGVLGQAQVPFNKDPQAKDKPSTPLSVPSRPIQITVTEPLK